ncbi:hypothetical protein Pcinc_039775 [Petrolisthes cinctipes]|uniref:Potassium channel domain-containing protein n=1 Tax=Petrolisthes cinctipes TaxID=88211 RepID=A0AAE1BP40_PETCI|nr:hypothetical protein Pcinc_039775 [Petrolisthes cinctipes]
MKGGVGCWGVGIDAYAIPVLSALIVYLLGAALDIIFRSLKVKAFNRGQHWKVYHYVTPIFTLLAALLFLIEAVDMRESLVVCKPWDWAQWCAYIIHVYFLFRLLMMWLYSYQMELVATLVDIFLFTQGCTVVAGALQVAEEVSMVYGLHADTQGQLNSARPFPEYFYWTVVTLSTVGYGEITPSTTAGEVVVVIAIIFFVVWFAGTVGVVSEWVGTVMQPRPIVPLRNARHRIVLLGCTSQALLEQILKDINLKKRASLLEIIILGKVDGELMPPADLPVFVVMEEDFTSCLGNLMLPEIPEKRMEDTLVILTDPLAEDPLKEDQRALYCLYQCKRIVRETKVVIQVFFYRTQQLVENSEGWQVRDCVVCREDVIAGLVTQAVVADAAGSILANLITSPTAGQPTKDMDNLQYALSENFSITTVPGNQETDGKKAAWEQYLKGQLLLGCVSFKASAFSFFPSRLRKSWSLVVISAGDKQNIE